VSNFVDRCRCERRGIVASDHIFGGFLAIIIQGLRFVGLHDRALAHADRLPDRCRSCKFGHRHGGHHSTAGGLLERTSAIGAAQGPNGMARSVRRIFEKPARSGACRTRSIAFLAGRAWAGTSDDLRRPHVDGSPRKTMDTHTSVQAATFVAGSQQRPCEMVASTAVDSIATFLTRHAVSGAEILVEELFHSIDP